MNYVLIEFRYRLTRFRYRLVTDYLLLNGVEISIKENGNNKGLTDEDLNKELLKDLIANIYSFSGKLYGHRSAKFRKIRQCVKHVIEKEK